MSSILVHIAVQSGRIKKGSLEVLSRCRELVSGTSHLLDAVIIAPDADRLASEVSHFGADRIYTFSSPQSAEHRNALLVDTLAHAVEKSGPFLVALASTEATKDILGALAVRTGAAVIPDVASLDLEGGAVRAERPVMAARYLAAVESDAGLKIVSVRSGSYEATEQPSESEVIPLEPAAAASTPSGELREVVESTASGVDLSEADVVVAAGRGVKDEEGRQLVLDLAETLGAAIGASRAVVENGLFPASAQIGQTGKVVSPDLYISVGISGAIQHVAGMLNSRTIIAINKDPEAPIFQYATYGLVGDLYKILPELTSAMRDARSRE